MKKILVIGLTERLGGVETYIYNVCCKLMKKGYKFYFLVHGADHCVYQQELQKLFNDNEQHFYFIKKYKSNFLGTINDLRKFYKLHQNDFDVVCLETGSTAEFMYIYPFCKKIKSKILVHSHAGSGFNKLTNLLFKPILNKYTDIKLSCSDFATKWLFGKKYEKSVIVINNGIDCEKFTYNEQFRNEIRNIYKIENNTIILGHVGRFSLEKNHKFMINLMKKISEKKENYLLMLVGDGLLKEEIMEYVKKMGLEKKVIFVGKTSETYKYYSAFDIFIMPSIYEGLPIVGIESQCEGLKCIFSSNIDKQIMITKTSKMIDLNEDKWVNEITSNDVKIDRLSAAFKVKNKGYDIDSIIDQIDKLIGIEYEKK